MKSKADWKKSSAKISFVKEVGEDIINQNVTIFLLKKVHKQP